MNPTAIKFRVKAATLATGDLKAATRATGDLKAATRAPTRATGHETAAAKVLFSKIKEF